MALRQPRVVPPRGAPPRVVAPRARAPPSLPRGPTIAILKWRLREKKRWRSLPPPDLGSALGGPTHQAPPQPLQPQPQPPKPPQTADLEVALPGDHDVDYDNLVANHTDDTLDAPEEPGSVQFPDHDAHDNERLPADDYVDGDSLLDDESEAPESEEVPWTEVDVTAEILEFLERVLPEPKARPRRKRARVGQPVPSHAPGIAPSQAPGPAPSQALGPPQPGPASSQAPGPSQALRPAPRRRVPLAIDRPMATQPPVGWSGHRYFEQDGFYDLSFWAPWRGRVAETCGYTRTLLGATSEVMNSQYVEEAD